MIWVALPVFLAIIVTNRIEWIGFVAVAAVFGTWYGRIEERRLLRGIVEEWVSSIQDDPHLAP